MRSISRAVPAAFAVLALALALGFASSLWTSSDAEAANDPSLVAAPVMVDADSCTTVVTGYPYGGIYNGIYGYPGYPYYGGYQASFPCVSPAYCVGMSSYNYYYPYLQPALVCPGPPATIEMPATNAATCASASNISVKVRDANGLNVVDGTSVSFSVAPFGTITGTASTDGGQATASLTTPTKTSGSLTVTVQAGSVTQTGTVDVSCSAPGTVAYGSGGSTSTQAPTVIYVMPGGGGGY